MRVSQVDKKLQALLTEHGLECAPPLTTARVLDKLVSSFILLISSWPSFPICRPRPVGLGMYLVPW